ncbi:hypothetical protein AB0I27_23045 [Streptomyces sp. NPDC050597]|uniref:hypothetical protein n=1 Tax=Streptomyces sp. NPDC050597 TaxID=3157212 RepID=UPI00344538A2
MKPFQSPPPRIERADVPLSKLQSDLRDLVAQQRVDVAAERLQRLLGASTDNPAPTPEETS